MALRTMLMPGLLATAIVWAASPAAHGAEEFLDPDKAFKVSARAAGDKTVEVTFRRYAAFRDPVGERDKPARFDPAGAHPPDLFTADQPAGFQRLQMLQHGSECHAERLRQLADGRRSAAQPFQDLAARGLDKGPQDAVDLGIVKHGLEY